jgi:hypothetical protein
MIKNIIKNPDINHLKDKKYLTMLVIAVVITAAIMVYSYIFIDNPGMFPLLLLNVLFLVIGFNFLYALFTYHLLKPFQGLVVTLSLFGVKALLLLFVFLGNVILRREYLTEPFFLLGLMIILFSLFSGIIEAICAYIIGILTPFYFLKILKRFKKAEE